MIQKNSYTKKDLLKTLIIVPGKILLLELLNFLYTLFIFISLLFTKLLAITPGLQRPLIKQQISLDDLFQSIFSSPSNLFLK